MQGSTPVTVALSDLSVAAPWTDWTVSAWIYFFGDSAPNVLTTNPAHKLEITGGNLVLSGDNIATQTTPVTASLMRKWHMLILGSNQQETYASMRFRDETLGTLSTSGLNGGVPAPLTALTTFQVMSFSIIFSVRVM